MIVDAQHQGQRLDNFLASELPGVPRSLVYRLIRKGQVRVNGGRARPGARLSEGDDVRVPPATVSSGKPAEVPLRIVQSIRDSVIHEHADFIVLDKPAGLAVHGGSGIRWGVIDALRQIYAGEALELVHRLDRDTSGCLLVARNAVSLRALRAQFRARNTEKRYLCLVHGRFPEERMVVDAPLEKAARGGERFMRVSEQGKASSTEFRLLEHLGGHSYLEAFPITGRTHQIRVHAAHVGHPLAGDVKYGTAGMLEYWRDRGLERLFLHAHGLAFEFPEGHRQQISAPLPDELRAVLDALA